MTKAKPISIDKLHGVKYPIELIDPLLDQLFVGASSITIEKRLEGGFSGCVVMVVKADHGLRSVIKAGPLKQIKKEWENYNKVVRRKWSEVAVIDGYKVVGPWAGLHYRFVGNVFEVKSFYEFARDKPVEEVVSVLKKALFPRIGDVWAQRRRIPFRFQTSYDRILPVNLVLETTHPAPGARPPIEVNGRKHGHEPVEPASRVRLQEFQITEIQDDGDKYILTLDVPSERSVKFVPYRMKLHHWKSDEPSELPVEDTIIHQMEAIVVETRETLLRKYARRVLDARVSLDSPTLDLPGLAFALPNPLLELASILQTEFATKHSDIHGDLNLENILSNFRKEP